jgi:uncharacterized protein YaiI (UPF0178 family)
LRIIIDADACPRGAKNICQEQADKYKLELVMVIDDAHELEGNFTVIKVSRGNDSVDHKIITMSQKDDIIVTQDYGLANILLERTAGVIHPKGFLYTIFNIESLMFQRHMGQKIRKGGGRTKGPSKRGKSDDIEFEKVLMQVLEKSRK